MVLAFIDHRSISLVGPIGIAAVNIGGSTLHRWAGIGLGNDMVKQLKSASSKKNIKNWTKTDVLIIDEISLISGELFDMLEELARQVGICISLFNSASYLLLLIIDLANILSIYIYLIYVYIYRFERTISHLEDYNSFVPVISSNSLQ